MLTQPPRRPNYEALLRGFGRPSSSCASSSAGHDRRPALGGNELFRDPERLAEARAFVESALAGAVAAARTAAAFSRADVRGEPVSNQMAVRAADAVIAEPGQRYNPLFLAGPSGVGKTHLLNAIGNELASTPAAAARVACVGAQLFIDELIAALQEGTIDRLRARYRAADALLIDDVQFVAGKERTQEELLAIRNGTRRTSRGIHDQLRYEVSTPPSRTPAAAPLPEAAP